MPSHEDLEQGGLVVEHARNDFLVNTAFTLARLVEVREGAVVQASSSALDVRSGSANELPSRYAATVRVALLAHHTHRSRIESTLPTVAN
jgi:hypothetical protein